MSRLSEQMERAQRVREQLPHARVVWFDKDKGIGFIRPITRCDCPLHEHPIHHPCGQCFTTHPEDVKVFHTAIDSNRPFKELFKGQEVEYELRESHNPNFKYEAGYVRVVSQ